MRTFLSDCDQPVVFRSRVVTHDFAGEPGIAGLHAFAGALMELLGPAFWAALVVMLLQAELMPAADGWAL